MFDELSLDRFFKAKLDIDLVFQHWLIDKTKFNDRPLDLIIEKIWHQRWWRDPDTKKDSETDIFLVFLDRATGERVALHIENKLKTSVWEPQQAINYRKRARARMRSYNYQDFQTVLMAPKAFIDAWSQEASQFDVWIYHEEVANFVPEFASSS